MVNTNYAAKTFFVTIWEKSLENLGIEVDWEHPEEFAKRIEEVLNDQGGNHYGTLCVSAEGAYHVHDIVTYENAKRRNTVAKSLGNAHVEEMRGSKEEAAKYINKEGKFEEKGEKIIARYGKLDVIENNQGTRNDLSKFDKEALKPGFNINEWILKNCGITNKARLYEKRYYRLLEVNTPLIRDIEVIYVEGESGSGKTYKAVTENPNAFRASIDSKNNFPFDGYKGEETLILDELRPGEFNIAYLLQILDGYKMRVNVKGGSTLARWNKVIITSAFPLDAWFKDENGKYENLRAQFMRRIKKHYIAKNYEWYDYETKRKEDLAALITFLEG